MHPSGYFALLLTDAAAARLRALATLPEPLAHHCTIRHGTRDPADLPPPFAASDIGKTFRLQVLGVATRADGGVQAAAVGLVLADGRVLEAGFSENRVPHVTLATDGVTEPVEANALLEAGFERAMGPVVEAVLLHSDAWKAPEALADEQAPR